MQFLALLGAQVGMSVLSGVMGNSQQAKQVKAQNKQIVKQNQANLLQAEATVLSMEAQRSMLRQQTAKHLELARTSARGSTGGIEASVGAAGIKGATVEAIKSDVERDLQAVEYETESRYVWSEYDINMNQQSVLSQSKLGMTPMQSYNPKSLGSMVAEGAMQAAGTYAGQYFQFGSVGGSKTAPTKGGSKTAPTKTWYN